MRQIKLNSAIWVALIFIWCVAARALADGFYLHGMKLLSKQIAFLEYVGWFSLIYLISLSVFGKIGFIKMVVLYCLIRFVLFMYLHNLAAGLPLTYIGTVAFFDRILAVVSLGGIWMMITAQAVCVGFIVAIIRGKV